MMSAPAGRPVILQLLCEHAQPFAIAEALTLSGSIAKGGGTALVASPHPLLLSRAARYGAQAIALSEVGGRLAQRRITAEIAKIVAQYQVDLMHLRGGPLLSVLAPVVAEGKVPAIVTLHDDDGPAELRGRTINKAIRNAAAILSGSSWIAAAYQHVRAGREPVLHQMPFVDLVHYDADNIPAERVISLAQAWNLPEARSLLLLPEQKSLDRESAWLRIAFSDTAFSDYWLVSPYDPNGDTVWNVQALAPFQPLPCRDFPASYKLADAVVIITPDREAGLYALLTARAMGRPVIVTDKGPARDVLADTPLHWLVPDGDGAAIRQAVMAALAVPLAERNAQAGRIRESVLDKTGQEPVCRQLLRVYKQVLQTRRALSPVETA